MTLWCVYICRAADSWTNQRASRSIRNAIATDVYYSRRAQSAGWSGGDSVRSRAPTLVSHAVEVGRASFFGRNNAYCVCQGASVHNDTSSSPRRNVSRCSWMQIVTSKYIATIVDYLPIRRSSLHSKQHERLRFFDRSRRWVEKKLGRARGVTLCTNLKRIGGTCFFKIIRTIFILFLVYI